MGSFEGEEKERGSRRSQTPLDVQREVQNRRYSSKLIEFCRRERGGREKSVPILSVERDEELLTLPTLVHARKDQSLASLRPHVVDESDVAFPLNDVARSDNVKKDNGERAVSLVLGKEERERTKLLTGKEHH